MRTYMSRITLLLAALALTVGFAWAAQAEDVDIGISVDVENEQNETDSEEKVCSEDIVKIGESVEVKENEVVRGDVVCIGGDVTVAGIVEGDAVCIGGTLTLDSTAVVEGDAVAVGGSIQRHDDARVEGESISINIGPLGRGFPWNVAPAIGRFSKLGPFMGLAFMARVARFIAVLVIAILVVAFLPGPTRRLETATRKSFWRCFLIGLLGEVLILPFFIFLIISIVGIALVPVAIVGLAVAFLFGLIGFSLLAGNIFFSRFRTSPVHPVGATAMGVLLINILVLLGALIGVAVLPLGVGIVVVGKIAVWVAYTAGFGAVILTRFGSRLPAEPSTEPRGQTMETS